MKCRRSRAGGPDGEGAGWLESEVTDTWIAFVGGRNRTAVQAGADEWLGGHRRPGEDQPVDRVTQMNDSPSDPQETQPCTRSATPATIPIVYATTYGS